MQKSDTKKGFGWGYLIVGILFTLCSFVAFWDPTTNLEALTILFAVLAIINGIWMIARPSLSGLRIVVGVIEIIVGIFMMFNIGWAMLALPYIFAIWFIIDSLFRLFTIGSTRALGTGYFVFSLIINILCVIVGIMLLFRPITAAITLSFLVGFYLMVAGIQCIVMAFSKQDTTM